MRNKKKIISKRKRLPKVIVAKTANNTEIRLVRVSTKEIENNRNPAYTYLFS